MAGFNSKNMMIHNPETALCTQVLLACERGKFEYFEEYLENNVVNINQQDSNGSTALHFAVAQNNVKCVDLILRKQADPNIKDDCGCTPLTLAMGRYASSAVGEVLLKNGAKINIANNWGNTALHSAVHAGDIHCVQLLLKYGVDPAMKNKKGKTAVDVGEDRDHTELNTLLATVGNVRCAHCNKKGDKGNNLKLCTGCKTVQYCSKECQKLDWKYGHKQLCSGYVLTSTIMKPASFSDQRKLSKKKFIVKVQLPLNIMSQAIEGGCMVYNRNKAFLHLLNPTDQDRAFKVIIDKIKKDGFMGVKAYYWAEIDSKNSNRVKIFYREPTVFQDW